MIDKIVAGLNKAITKSGGGVNNAIIEKAIKILGWHVRPPQIWQPIDTAPSDGTKFLAYWPPSLEDTQYAICHFSFGVIWPSWIGKDNMPTHWMPLPTPPDVSRETPKGPKEDRAKTQ